MSTSTQDIEPLNMTMHSNYDLPEERHVQEFRQEPCITGQRNWHEADRLPNLYSVDWYRGEVDKLDGQLRLLKTENDRLAEEQVEMRKAQLPAMTQKLQLQRVEKELADLRSDSEALEEIKSRLGDDLEHARMKISELETQAASLSADLDDKSQELASKEEQLKFAIEQAEQQLKMQQVKDAASKVKLRESGKQCDEGRKSTAEFKESAMTKLQKARQAITDLVECVEMLSATIRQLKTNHVKAEHRQYQRIRHLYQRIWSNRAVRANLRAKRDQQKHEIKSVQAERNELRSELDGLKNVREQLTTKLRLKDNYLERLRSRAVILPLKR